MAPGASQGPPPPEPLQDRPWQGTGSGGGPAAAALAKLPRQELMDRQPALVYLARLAPSSQRTMRTALDTFAALATVGRCDHRTLPWADLRYQHLAAVRAALAARYSPAHANKIMAAVKGALKEAWRLGQLDLDSYRRAVDQQPVRGERLPAGRAIAGPEISALLASCRYDTLGRRDRALIAVLYGTGLRRSELVALDVDDWDPSTDGLRVTGKGSKERLVYLLGDFRAALEDWLDRRGRGPGPLFLPAGKTGRLLERRMADGTVAAVLRHRSALAGTDTAPTPHDFRRTFIGDLLDRGADLVTVSKLVGHAQVGTTARYDRRDEAAKRHAAGLLVLPSSDAVVAD